MMGKRKKKKTVTLGEIGFAMKHEASKTEGDVLLVSKDLWLEIAEVLMETDRNLKTIEKGLDEMLKAGDKDGRCEVDQNSHGCF